MIDNGMNDTPLNTELLWKTVGDQTNPSRWDGEQWPHFVKHLGGRGIAVHEGRADASVFISDAGGLAHGMPHGVVRPFSSEHVAEVLKAAQVFEVPVTTRGGGLTTEGESIAFGGLLLDMSSMNRVKAIDSGALTVRTEAGIYWHQLAETLRREGLDYLSAPLNLTSSVGGTLGVGGIDINSPRLGCSADQCLSLTVVTPTGEIVECSEKENSGLMERVLLGYGQFGVITEATLKIRPFSPISMKYFYYSSLATAIEDLKFIAKEDAADYSGILTIMDRAINLLVAFDSDEREKEFYKRWRRHLRGHGEANFGLRMAGHYLFRPYKFSEAAYLMGRRLTLFPEFSRPEYMNDGKIIDRTVVFSRAVWKFWGGSKMVIPDLAASQEKIIEAVERGNEVCRRYFRHYTLYCVGIKLSGRRERYEMSCIPPDAEDMAFGCEFEPMLRETNYSRDYLQSFKNAIYDIGVDMGLSYYRFGGMMKGYIRKTFGDALVDRHLAMKREADPAMILNRDVIF
jgi:FAD/FMN-containing dehydrogenase